MAVMKKFFKMHGLGNDFVILDCRDGSNVSPAAAKEIANRRTGIGCDQLIILKNPHHNNDIFLEFRNNDGSKSSACGNGTRCVANMILEEKNHWTNSNFCKGPLDFFPPEPFRWIGALIIRNAVRRKESAEDKDLQPRWIDKKLAKIATSIGRLDKTSY